ncbi:beta-N-acetylhexosaminidase [Haladaptatus sp. T7]|uniref:beta-N-acetylhexosaminidase n=1 Tax=Haladaptatus sp. T7 TaxID=2029368 RepID=UPI0021A252A1|nr:beta-N-acetylhexosaminidase [Haladaptatus sp. T7]GKZ14638.1 beta-glucosidase [Haladaptatus sp. T7]
MSSTTEPESAESTNPPATHTDFEVDVSSLSLPEKVGQLFVAGFDGTTPTAAIEELVSERHLGGVIYFSRNVESPGQLRTLSRTLQGFVPHGKPPLLLSIDQEGGRVARLPWGTELPSAMALGATDDPELASRAGRAVGSELRALGVDIDLAPVLDVNNNPDNPVIGVRSFGERPERVAELGAAFADGLQDAGVVACGKHFPGHGDTAVDSHLDLPVIDHDRERLDAVELKPFRRAIDAGIGAIMTTHVAFPTIAEDAERPATLSPRVVTGLLREELSFDGLVVTDCMEMKAIADGVGTVEGCVQAVEAGCDQLCVSHTPAKQRAAIDAVIEAVESGRIAESHIDAAVRRVLRAKRVYGAGYVGGENEWDDGAAECRSTAREVAERGVTLVRDEADALPLPQRVAVYEFDGGRGSPAEEASGRGGAFASALSATGVAVDGTVLAPGELPEERANSPRETVVCTSDAASNPDQAAVVQALQEAGANPIVVATRNPYDLAAMPNVETYLTTYDDTPASLAAAAELLAGKGTPSGRLPVTIPDGR